MRRRHKIALTIVIAGAALALIPLVHQEDSKVAFRFEDFESFLDVRPADEIAAARAFQDQFPAGTQLEDIEALFVAIGGKCYTAPKDYPNQLICRYGHKKYPLIPAFLLPVFSMWAVIIGHDAAGRTTGFYKLTAYTEGP